MKRHEIKYLLKYPEYILLSRRISALLERDSHTFDENGYLISSVYFDDFADSSFFEKLSGVQYRKKYRLRYYNRSADFIVLECKSKTGDFIEKESVRIDEETFYSLAGGRADPLGDRNEPVAKEVYGFSKTKLLKPRLFCEYVREAYVHPLSETRVTFDKSLECASPEKVKIEEKPRSYRVFPEGDVILEVKYNEFIPKFITETLALGGVPVSSSKYEHSYNYLSNHYLLKKGEKA